MRRPQVKNSLAVILTATIGLLATEIKAALQLTLNEATANRMSLTISGFFEENVVGSQLNWLAIKGNWLIRNGGLNVDWIADSVGEGTIETRPGVTTVEDSIALSGFNIYARVITANSSLWGDSIFYGVDGPITAGTTVSGTLTLIGSDLFKFTRIQTLQLVSGFDNARLDFARLEASVVVPEPTVYGLFSLGAAGLSLRRSKEFSQTRNEPHPRKFR